MVEHPLFEGVIRNSEKFAPFHEGVSFSERSHIMARMTVIAVFLNSDPSTILRRIITVVINTVYGEVVCIPIRHSPLRKCFAIVSPLLADFDASAAVTVIKR
jgi:hypothetical protein